MSGAGELRITRLERSSAGGWLFAFAADDSDTLFAGIALVKALPEQRRRYRKDERAWWIASEALGALLIMFPGLDEYMGSAEYARAGGSLCGLR
jgi:hypothetical protein